MFMNDNLNDYFYLMGGTSVVLEKPKDWNSWGHERHAVVDGDMKEFIDALRLKRPTWRFKSTERVYNNEGQKLREFSIFDGDEQLGHIWLEKHWRTGDTRYCFNNHRLEATRQRGHAAFSTKIKVATKKVLETFGAKSLNELAADTSQLVTSVLSGLYSNAQYKYTSAKKKAISALETYIENNWDTLKAHTTNCGDIDLRALRLKYEAANFAFDSRDKGNATTLFMHGEKMVMHRKGTIAKTIAFEELTDKQRATLGMLKLMEKAAFIEGVGVRVDDNVFYLLD